MYKPTNLFQLNTVHVYSQITVGLQGDHTFFKLKGDNAMFKLESNHKICKIHSNLDTCTVFNLHKLVGLCLNVLFIDKISINQLSIID